MKETIVLALVSVLVFGLVIGCGQEVGVEQIDLISEQIEDITSSRIEVLISEDETASQEIKIVTEYIEYETAIVSFKVPFSWQVEKVESPNYKNRLKLIHIYPDPKNDTFIQIENPASGGYKDALTQGFEEITECSPNLIMKGVFGDGFEYWFCYSNSSHIPVYTSSYGSEIETDEEEFIGFLSSLRR